MGGVGAGVMVRVLMVMMGVMVRIIVWGGGDNDDHDDDYYYCDDDYTDNDYGNDDNNNNDKNIMIIIIIIIGKGKRSKKFEDKHRFHIQDFKRFHKSRVPEKYPSVPIISEQITNT